MHDLETLKKLNSETGREEKVCPKCGGALLRSGTCAGFSHCEDCGWVVLDDS